MKKWTLLFVFCIVVGGVMAQIDADCNTGSVSEDQTICSGSEPDPLSISDSEAGADLQWEYSSDNIIFSGILGETGTSFSPGALTNTTYYKVEVSDGACDLAYSETITISVDEPSVAGTIALETSSNETICQGGSVTFNLVDNTGNIQWQSSEENQSSYQDIPGETSTQLTAADIQIDTYYRAKIENGACEEVFSNAILISVDLPPTAPTGIAGYSGAICSGTSLTLTTTGGDVGSGADYQWGTGAVNDGNEEYVGSSFETGEITSNTTYWVRLKGNTACDLVTAHKSQGVTVHQPPTAPTGIAGAENPICNGSSVTLTVTGGADGTGGTEYEWGSGDVVGANSLDIMGGTDQWDTPTLTTDATFWVRRIGTYACTNTTGGVTEIITVRPVPSVTISNPGELCQLPGQQIVITNETQGQQPLNIQWATGTGQSGAVIVSTNVEINLDLSSLSDNSTNFTILSYGFTDAPGCVNSNVISEVFAVKPRPTITSVSHNDLTSTSNPLCQGYGPVEYVVSSPNNVEWVSSYYINGQLNTGGVNQTPYNLQIESTGNHNFVIDSLWYSTGLACGYNPADYEQLSYYSNSVTIRPTPPAVELVDGVPSILQFCDFTDPLVVDSVAKIDDLNIWVDNESGYTIKWKSSNDNSAPNLNNIPLETDGGYYPVFELDGCHSKLNSNSLPLIVSLMALPDLQQSSLVFPTDICSGTPFDMLFNPGENISHFGISDFEFDPPLSSPNITETISYSNISGSNFSITNSSSTASSWTANIYAQNKNVSEVNPVTCWAEPIAIEITVNPNATFNPATTNFESCQNGSDFSIDPGWNGIGDVEWDDPLGFPASINIDGLTKIITVNMSAQAVPPGVYPIRVSGGYPDSNCEVDTSFTVSIYATPGIETRILDIDGTICHNEYTHIEVIDPQLNHVYQWSCTGCESGPEEGSYFLPQWTNPEPLGGTWADLAATYSVTAIDESTNLNCANSQSTSVNILADYASCPEGIDFFFPNGLSIVDGPALYFQWYDVESAGVFSAISGATDQTYFPNDAIEGCDTSRYIVATSLYSDRCWSTTVNCFEEFGMRACDGPKSKANSPKFLLYPNPVVGNDVILENLSNDLEGRYTIDLIDIAGKTLMSDIIEIETIGQKRILLPNVDQGVYLLRVSNSRYSETFKIIIN